MNRTFYTILFYLALPVILCRLWFRGRKAPAYRERWLERLGVLPEFAADKAPLWIHAVSVGETMAIVPLVKLLQARHPELPIVMTTMTPTGAERVAATFGESVRHFYCPYDLPFALNRFLNKLNPRACIIVETELWPNLINACRNRNLPVLVANARLSARSAKGYAKFAGVTEPMLRQIDLIAAQNETDGKRFVDLGLPADRLNVTGSIKFDVAAPEGSARLAYSLRQLWGQNRPVIVGASTHEGEEKVLLDTYRAQLEQFPDLLLVIVPRHPERFDTVANLVKQSGFSLARRSQGDQPKPDTQVYLGDTMGELMKLLAAADIAFVGGSLIERGGHNPLEPAVLKKPVVMGPHFFNFEQICDQLSEAGGLSVVENAEAFERRINNLLTDKAMSREQGEKGYEFVVKNQGALERLYTLIDRFCLTKE